MRRSSGLAEPTARPVLPVSADLSGQFSAAAFIAQDLWWIIASQQLDAPFALNERVKGRHPVLCLRTPAGSQMAAHGGAVLKLPPHRLHFAVNDSAGT